MQVRWRAVSEGEWGERNKTPARRAPRLITALAWLGLVILALTARPSRAVAPTSHERRIGLNPAVLASGDLLFRRGRSLVSRAVLAAEGGSEYSHVGLVSVVHGRAWVIHSVPAEGSAEQDGAIAEPVTAFLEPEKASAAVLYRPRNREAAAIAEKIAWRFARARLPFDAAFDLKSADKLYCTELVWRAYKSGGLDLAPEAESGRERYLLPSRLMRSPALQRVGEFKEEEVRP